MNMTTKIKDIAIHSEEGKVLIMLSKKIYEREAIFASAHKFTDKCTILIEPIEQDSVGVYFQNKDDNDDDKIILKNLAGEFCNEVLDQQLRLDIERKYGNIRDLIVKQAFSPLENLKDEINYP